MTRHFNHSHHLGNLQGFHSGPEKKIWRPNVYFLLKLNQNMIQNMIFRWVSTNSFWDYWLKLLSKSISVRTSTRGTLWLGAVDRYPPHRQNPSENKSSRMESRNKGKYLEDIMWVPKPKCYKPQLCLLIWDSKLYFPPFYLL